MKTATIYCINEKNCTTEVAQSVNDNEDDMHGAVLNARTFTFDELLSQHMIFKDNTQILDTFRKKIHSCLRVARSIPVETDDMTERFVSEHGENIFFRGFVGAVIEKYESERLLLTKPVDRVKMELRKKQIQDGISERIDAFFDDNLKLICSDAFFDSGKTLDYFSIQPMRTIIASDEFTFNVFHESDNCLIAMLSELGQIIHRNKQIPCKCGFCGKLFVGSEGEICCSSEQCRNAHEIQKKQIYREHTEEYSNIKRTYDSYVRNLKKHLVDAGIDKFHPAEFDEFIQAKDERMAKMDSLKKHLIRNSLPTDELYELGEKFKAEMKAVADVIMERYK